MILAVAIWHIWENRNIRNGEKMPHPSCVVGKIKAYVDFILLYNFRSTTSTRREHQTTIPKWSLLPAGSVLVNVDAAIFAQTKRMGIGVVICNHLGLVLAASRRLVDHVDNPELGRAIAMRHALTFAEETGFQQIIVASDCASLVSKVKSGKKDRSHIGAILFDIKRRAPKFMSCNFTHVSRSCNEAAHVLAKSAEHDVGPCWFNVSPDIIRAIVCTEQISESIYGAAFCLKRNYTFPCGLTLI